MTEHLPTKIPQTSGGMDLPPSSVRRYWDSIADAWSSHGYDALWRKHSDAVNRILVEKWLPHDGVGVMLKTDAFDEAVSEGLSQILASRAERVIYIDGSLGVLQLARSTQGSILAVCCDVRQLPFASGAIEIVVSNSTLDHFSNSRHIVASLKELKRVLCTSGQLILTLDNPVNPLVSLRQLLPKNLLRRFRLIPYFVGVTLGPSRLKHHLGELDFSIQKMEAIMHCPRVLAVAISRIVQRRGSPQAQKRYLSFLAWFERLECWPTRYLSGYYIAVNAINRAKRM